MLTIVHSEMKRVRVRDYFTESVISIKCAWVGVQYSYDVFACVTIMDMIIPGHDNKYMNNNI